MDTNYEYEYEDFVLFAEGGEDEGTDIGPANPKCRPMTRLSTTPSPVPVTSSSRSSSATLRAEDDDNDDDDNMASNAPSVPGLGNYAASAAIKIEHAPPTPSSSSDNGQVINVASAVGPVDQERLDDLRQRLLAQRQRASAERAIKEEMVTDLVAAPAVDAKTEDPSSHQRKRGPSRPTAAELNESVSALVSERMAAGQPTQTREAAFQQQQSQDTNTSIASSTKAMTNKSSQTSSISRTTTSLPSTITYHNANQDVTAGAEDAARNAIEEGEVVEDQLTEPVTVNPSQDDMELWLRYSGYYDKTYREGKLTYLKLKLRILERERRQQEDAAEVARIEGTTIAPRDISRFEVDIPSLPVPSPGEGFRLNTGGPAHAGSTSAGIKRARSPYDIKDGHHSKTTRHDMANRSARKDDLLNKPLSSGTLRRPSTPRANTTSDRSEYRIRGGANPLNPNSINVRGQAYEVSPPPRYSGLPGAPRSPEPRAADPPQDRFARLREWNKDRSKTMDEVTDILAERAEREARGVRALSPDRTRRSQRPDLLDRSESFSSPMRPGGRPGFHSSPIRPERRESFNNGRPGRRESFSNSSDYQANDLRHNVYHSDQPRGFDRRSSTQPREDENPSLIQPREDEGRSSFGRPVYQSFKPRGGGGKPKYRSRPN